MIVRINGIFALLKSENWATGYERFSKAPLCPAVSIYLLKMI